MSSPPCATGLTPQRMTGLRIATPGGSAHQSMSRQPSVSPPMPSPPPLLRAIEGTDIDPADLPQLVDELETPQPRSAQQQSPQQQGGQPVPVPVSAPPPALDTDEAPAPQNAYGYDPTAQAQMMQAAILQQAIQQRQDQQLSQQLALERHQYFLSLLAHQQQQQQQQQQFAALQNVPLFDYHNHAFGSRPGGSPTASSLSQGLSSTPPLSVSPQLQPVNMMPGQGRSISPLEAIGQADGVRGYFPQNGGASQSQHHRGELPRESAWTREVCWRGRNEGAVLVYASARGSSSRVSWRNKLWSNNALLNRRFGAELPKFFRENYADRSPASEPLLHNNYPRGSRVYFQGRLSPAHCVCHHLVQIFEAFSVTPEGVPDPLGLQAVWIGMPSPGSGRVYGYAKFSDAAMATAAVGSLRCSILRRPNSRDLPPGGHPPPERAVSLLCEVARRMEPPLLPSPEELMQSPPTRCSYEWGSEAAELGRVMHVLNGRLATVPKPVLERTLGIPMELISEAAAAMEAALMARYGEGIVTCALVDSVERRQACSHQNSAPAREPVLLDDVSFANDQKPGHNGGSRNQSRCGSPTASSMRLCTAGQQSYSHHHHASHHHSGHAEHNYGRSRVQVAQSP